MKMKTLPFLFFLLSGVLSVSAQPYQSMFGSGDNASTEWVFKYGGFPGDIIDSAYIEKDTIVNGLTYKKIVTANSPTFCGLIREDVNIGWVWYKGTSYVLYPSDTIEQVAFRFDLKVGDTFDISNQVLQQGNYPDSLNIVDSIRYVNGLKHIYFKGIYQPMQGGYNEPFTIIEGIGSNMGILWKHKYGLGEDYLLCSYKNSQKTPFQNSFYIGACTIKTGNINSLNAHSDAITLYPMPIIDEVRIKNNTTEKINKIQIISQTGQLVKEVTSLEITNVEIGEIPAGYFYLKLFTSNGYLITKSILKS